jgi:hypothetical protein
MLEIRLCVTELKQRSEGNEASYVSGNQQPSVGTVHGREQSLDVAGGHVPRQVVFDGGWSALDSHDQ